MFDDIEIDDISPMRTCENPSHWENVIIFGACTCGLGEEVKAPRANVNKLPKLPYHPPDENDNEENTMTEKEWERQEIESHTHPR